ncbi:VCATH, partial [Symbiodinium necroappetens]
KPAAAAPYHFVREGPCSRIRGCGGMDNLRWWHFQRLSEGRHHQPRSPASWLWPGQEGTEVLADSKLVGCRLGRGRLHAFAAP